MGGSRGAFTFFSNLTFENLINFFVSVCLCAAEYLDEDEKAFERLNNSTRYYGVQCARDSYTLPKVSQRILNFNFYNTD